MRTYIHRAFDALPASIADQYDASIVEQLEADGTVRELTVLREVTLDLEREADAAGDTPLAAIREDLFHAGDTHLDRALRAYCERRARERQGATHVSTDEPLADDGFMVAFTSLRGARRRYRFYPRERTGWWLREEEHTGCTWRTVGKEQIQNVTCTYDWKSYE